MNNLATRVRTELNFKVQARTDSVVLPVKSWYWQKTVTGKRVVAVVIDTTQSELAEEVLVHSCIGFQYVNPGDHATVGYQVGAATPGHTFRGTDKVLPEGGVFLETWLAACVQGEMVDHSSRLFIEFPETDKELVSAIDATGQFYVIDPNLGVRYVDPHVGPVEIDGSALIQITPGRLQMLFEVLQGMRQRT